MRILAITNLYPNPFDSTRGLFNRHQFRALAAMHDVHVISPISWVDELMGRFSRKGHIARGRGTVLDGIIVDHPRFLYPPKVLRSSYGSCYRRSIRRTFDRVVADFDPDVILATWAYPDGWAAVQLGRTAGLPVVIKVHGCDVLYGLSKNPDRQQRTEEALRGADAVVAVSRHLAESVQRLGVDPHHISVVYNGVDCEWFHPGSQQEARRHLGLTDEVPLLVCVANLFPVKGLDVLIDACARLAASGVRFQCRIIGEGPLRTPLQRQIQAAGLEGYVELVGSRPQRELPNWYRAASVFVLASHSEGVPGVLLEAMACGTPFVATRVGGTPEVAHLGNGQLVTAGNAQELARGIQETLQRRVTRTPNASSSRSHADSAVELSAILQSVCRRHPVDCPDLRRRNAVLQNVSG